MNKVYRAGIIPYTTTEDGFRYLFMRPSNPKYGGAQFQIAKGRIEPEETADSAAIREGIEELGLKEKNIKQLDYLGRFLGRTMVFLCEVSNTDLDRPHFETFESVWMSLSDFLANGRSIHHNVVRDAEAYLTCKYLKDSSDTTL